MSLEENAKTHDMSECKAAAKNTEESLDCYRAMAENKLRESVERSRVLIDALPDLIFRYSSEGVYLDAEVKDLERLTENGRKLYEAGKLIGANLYDAVPFELAEMVMKVIGRVVETGKTQVIEYKYLVAGEPRHHESRIIKSGPAEVMSIVRDITDRKLAEEALQYQLHYEQAVADISSRFVSSGGCIDENINHAIRLCGRLFGADRCYVFRFSDDVGYMTNTHEWCAEGVIPQIGRNQNYPISDTPWWTDQIRNSDIFQVADIEALPPEADKDKVEFRYEQIKSCLTIPMFREGKIFGFFGFDAVKEKKEWNDSQVALLKVIAETIAGAIINYESEQALKDSEERYREILATIEEGYYEVDLAGKIVFCNDSACRLFGGYSRKELLNTSYEKLFREPEEAFRTFNKVYVTGKAEKGLVLEIIRKDGSIAFGELSISVIKNKQGEVTGLKGLGRDVTERIVYERQLKYLSLYDQLTGIFNRAWFEAELERLDKSREYPITIVSADLDGLKLINDTLGHNAGDKLLVACANLIKESIRSSDILARVGGDEFSVILPRTDQATGESVVKRMRETINTYNENNKDLPLGLSLGLATADRSDISLKELFKRADDMMYRDKLYRSSSSRGKIVQSLLAALAERDYITEGHARRLEDLCRAVGEKINLGSHQLSDLALLTQVHDLGKVGVPDHILFKPGPLTEEEWQIMHTHPEKGYRIATTSPDLAGIADYILKHHECWDGSGYPLGLKGTEIPVECRILAIVDAFDAMTSKRPYNKKRTTEEAVQEIKKHSGIQFDPALVPVFLDVLSEVKG
jgi:diguanylate cyclase (GGDEF)-like protein/PAS domain S-box-containing protein